MLTISGLKNQIIEKKGILRAARQEIEEANDKIDRFEELLDHTRAELFELEDQLQDREEHAAEEE